MDFAWTVTDKTHTPPPKPPEPFRGYFTDIQRAARKSLPKKPSKDLCSLLGISLKSTDQEKEGSFVNVSVNAEPNLKPTGILTAESAPDAVPQKQTAASKWLPELPCAECQAGWSRRERTVAALTVYLGVVILLLLVIIVILAATLSATSHDDGPGNNAVNAIQSSKQPTVTSTISSRPSSTVAVTVTTLIHTIATSAVRKTSTSLADLSSSSTSMVQTSTQTSKNSSIFFTQSTPAASTETKIQTRSSTTSIRTSSSTKVQTQQRTSSRRPSSRSSATSSSSTAAVTFKPTSPSTPEVTTIYTATKAPTVTARSTTHAVTELTTKLFNSSTTPTRSTSAVSSSSKPITPSTAASSTTLRPVSFPKLATQTVSITCSSRDCDAARDTISKIDFNTSPCSDFYQFACGAWINHRKTSLINNPKGPKTTQEDMRRILLTQVKDLLSDNYSQFDTLAEKVSKRLYQSCVESNVGPNETQALEELHRALDVLGMTPVGHVVGTLADLVAAVNWRYRVTPFFTRQVAPVPSGRGYNVYGLKISPPTLNLEDSIYKRDLETNELAAEYIDAMAAILFTYISSFPTEESSPRKRRTSRYRRQTFLEERANYTQVYGMVLRAYYVESNISKLLEEEVGEYPEPEVEEETSIPRLIDTDIAIPWDAALGIAEPNVKVTLVYPNFFRKLDDLFLKLPTDDVKMYVFMTTLTQRIWKYMPFSLRQRLKYAGGHVHESYTELDCVSSSLELAKEEIHGIYIGMFTQKVLDSRLQLTNLNDLIKLAFQDLVTSSDWMQSDLKRVVSILMTKMRAQFSTVSYEIVATPGITGGEQSFLSLAMELHGQLYTREMGQLRSDVTVENSLDWTSPEPVYDSESNILGLPTALGVYLVSGDEALFELYGRIGKLMADQMIKVLTGELRRGVAPEWWGSDNLAAFDGVGSCFADQQSRLQQSYYDSGNMILSNGGLQLIKEVYMSSDAAANDVIPGTILTREMLFYLNIAQLHCGVDETSFEQQLHRQRVNNIILNQGNVEGLFSCPVGSPMVTEKKCSLL